MDYPTSGRFWGRLHELDNGLTIYPIDHIDRASGIPGDFGHTRHPRSAALPEFLDPGDDDGHVRIAQMVVMPGVFLYNVAAHRYVLPFLDIGTT